MLNKFLKEVGLTDAELLEVEEVIQGEVDFYGTLAYDKLFKHFLEEMPYGTAKARTGDPDQWILDRLGQIDLAEEQNPIKKAIEGFAK